MKRCRVLWLGVVLGLCPAAWGQEKIAAPAPPPAAAPAPPPANAVAVTVNGQPIPELAVWRGLKRGPPARLAEARPEILNFLIDNTLIDQYLTQLPVAVEAKEVDAKIQEVKEVVQKEG